MWITGALSAAVLVGALSGCGGGGDDGAADDGAADDDAGDDDGGDGGGAAFLTRASRSSTIALSDNGAWIANVNANAGTVSFFKASDSTRLATLATGAEPSSVVIGPDTTTAYVANRGDASVVRVRGIDTSAPAIDATIAVGAEPTGVALSPSGQLLFVAEMGESRVSVIDARTMEGLGSVAVDRPRALVVTNDLDDDDTDETLLVTEFYGEPVPGGETRDDGRNGRVRRFAVPDMADRGVIALAPIDSGFPRGGVEGSPTVLTSPNQLASLAVSQGRVFVTSVSASPEGPPRFDNNVFPVVYVADLATGAELRGAGGSTNLARKVVDAIPSPTAAAPRFIPGDLAGIDFVPDTNVSYVVGRAGDVMVRVVWDPAQVSVGSTQNVEIDLAGNDSIGKCQAPTGVVVNADATRAYASCLVTGRMAVVDLTSQQMVATVESTPAPQGAFELSALRGQRFYFTGRGRWSNAGSNGAVGGEGWSGCGSCHPDGLSDNMTWVFASGPRQTTSQDGSFSHGPGQQKQRIFNWTAIFDEHHDFERNTRDVSGGLGAITTADSLDDCNKLDLEQQVALAVAAVPIGGLARPLKELADDPNVATCGHKDWDDIDNFVRTIRPPRARRAIPTAKVDRGRQLFIDGGCARCHGGQGWTVSRRFFTPAGATNTALAAAPFLPPVFFPQTLVYPDGADPRAQISAQPPIPDADATGPAEPEAVAIAEAACVLRNVGSFGVPNDTATTDLLERRPFQGELVRSEGRAGYNVPSLYGLAMGAPYLHHGQAGTLEALFTDPLWQFHTNAGNANFSVALADAGKLDDLVSFLLSIDRDQPELGIATDLATGGSFDGCPAVF
ncbi:MAG TPA: YncE family protein [Kofleriaceae bacterium]|nr:YncE family protein [Kofleriaceae bacterium]